MTEKRLQWILRIALLVLLCATLGVRLVRCAILDRSAVLDGTLRWQGRTYRASAGRYCEDTQLAVATDANGAKWAVNSVEGDPNGEQFVVVRSFLDQYLYQNEAYSVPANGTVTAVYIDYERTDDTALLQTLQQVMTAERAADPIVCILQDVRSRSVSFCYDGCAVAPKISGWIVWVDGTLAVAQFDRDSKILDEPSGKRELICTPIPENLAQSLTESRLFNPK
ncbi:MAG: hypothetical protein IJC93_01215 [Clostridia bacterium]|nr:hypothetical protein [Clostridia bacterium]